jgi:hypothetical protein
VPWTAGRRHCQRPDIRSAGAALADFVLRTGVCRLPTWRRRHSAVRRDLTTAETALVAYVASLGEGRHPERRRQRADIVRGRDLFVANCSARHGPAGAEGPWAEGSSRRR